MQQIQINEIINKQKKICKKYNAEFFDTDFNLKVGISLNIKEGAFPINGLRHPSIGDTSGWYIWGGKEFSESDDFFLPLHIIHLNEWNPLIFQYLGLPPGYRFLFAKDYEDCWEDKSLLDI